MVHRGAYSTSLFGGQEWTLNECRVTEQDV
jgi:hypothetical protein